MVTAFFVWSLARRFFASVFKALSACYMDVEVSHHDEPCEHCCHIDSMSVTFPQKPSVS